MSRRHALHPHPAIDDGVHHRSALVSKGEECIGVDALAVKMTTEACIVGECVRHALLRELPQRNGILIEAMDEHASHMSDQVLLRVRIITEFLGSHGHSRCSRVG